jgi:hypothetical protein
MTQTQAIPGWLNRRPRQTHPRSEREKSITRTVIIPPQRAPPEDSHAGAEAPRRLAANKIKYLRV